MASSISIQSLLLARSTRTPSLFLENALMKKDNRIRKLPAAKRKISGTCSAMADQSVLGPAAAYAKDMERLDAKESLLLALKDAGGFEAFMSGKTTNTQHVDVNERIVSLERLNPTPRPTGSPYLEGQWNFEWFGSGSPGLYAARFLFERFHPGFANLSKLDLVIKDGYANVSATVKLLNSIESSFTVSMRLSVEGPLRMKEEYVEGILESPKVDENFIPEQLRGVFGRLQQLPVPITDALSGGLKVPLGGTFERLFMISYLDDEILIIRDAYGAPEVLTRLDPGPSTTVIEIEEPILEYQS